MRISDWSSDVCSSDLPRYPGAAAVPPAGCLALAAVILRMDMDQDFPVQPRDAAAFLGVSLRQVYDLAAPHGPIPCYRTGRRITFDRADLVEYRQKCRSTEIKCAVNISLNSTAPRSEEPRLNSSH